jgi:hypothetical protein
MYELQGESLSRRTEHGITYVWTDPHLYIEAPVHHQEDELTYQCLKSVIPLHNKVVRGVYWNQLVRLSGVRRLFLVRPIT